MLADGVLVPPVSLARSIAVLVEPAPATSNSQVIASQAQGVRALPGRAGQTVPLRFTLSGLDAGYANELGLVLVDNAAGHIGKQRPGDAGYAAAALRSPSLRMLFSGKPRVGEIVNVTLPAGRFFVFYFVQNGTARDVLAANPRNHVGRTPLVFFSITSANPDHFNHMREGPANVFGFEDVTGGGDQDYNDMVVRLDIGNPRNPPRLAAQLSHDTAAGASTDTDRITSDPSIQGKLTAAGKVIRFRGGFDSAPLASYANLLKERRPGGSFFLNRARINQIAKQALRDGRHVLHLVAEDEFHQVVKLHLAFTLDTVAPTLTFDLAAAFDSPPLGDGQTTFEAVALRGQTESGALVTLQDTGASTTAGASGAFEFPDVHLSHGANDFIVTASDLAGNTATARRTIILAHDDCGFDPNLTGWTVTAGGGTDPGKGSVSVDGSVAVLREGNSFLVTLERTFIVSNEASRLQFTFSDLDFDTTASGTMKDSFEVALLDAEGAALVFPFMSGRDAFFNIGEGQSAALGAGTTLADNMITTDLSGLAPGSTFQLVFRLVNNDADTDTSVRLSCVQIIAGAGASPRGVSGILATAAARPAVDFSALADVSGSLEAAYTRTSFQEEASVVYADLAVRNRGQYEVAGPIVAVVTRLSDPAVRIRDFDGLTPDGLPYYLISGPEASRLTLGDTSASRRIAFFNPTGGQFSYDLVLFGQLNRAPKFTSTPKVEALVGRSYVAAAAAADLDGDALAYSLLAAPVGMAIHSATGRLSWSPSAADLGNHTVIVQVADGRGGLDEQHYTLAVRDNVPNRPPVFASAPPVDAVVNSAYVYPPAVTDEDSDPLAFTLSGPAGMTVDSSTGRLDWTPTAGQLGLHYVSLIAADGRGGSATQTFAINVAPERGNHAPVIVSDPPTRFAVELPGTTTGEVSPNLLSLATNEQRTAHITVRVPPPAPIGSVDFLPASIDTSGVTTDAQTLQVSGAVGVAVRNQGSDAYDSSTAGIFEVLAFEDRDGDAAFTRGLDNVLGTATFAGSIAAGASVSVDVPLAGIIQFRDKPIWVAVDAGDAIPELDEVNNTLATGLDSRYQPTGDWLPMVQWQWRSPDPFVLSAATVAPLIDTNADGRIDERDVPAVLVNNSRAGSTRLVALRGDTGAVIFDVPPPAGVTLSPYKAAVVGDLDGDGRPEILLQNYFASSPFYAFNNDGTHKWTSQATTYESDLVLVDLDGDGKSEILRGRAAFNFDGTLRWTSGFPLNIVGGSYLGGQQNLGNARQPADLDLDGIPEIVASASAIDRDGKSLWEWFALADPATRNYSARLSVNGGPHVEQFRTNVPLGGGLDRTAVANLDDDPFPEIIVVSPASTSFPPGPSGGLWIFNHDGSLFAPPVGLLQQINPNSSQNHFIGPPTEIAIAVNRVPGSIQTFADPPRIILYVFETDGTEVWHKDLSPNFHSDRASLPSAFDFDGDGDAEVVYQDSEYLYILNGQDGATRFQLAITSPAGVHPTMIPVIADLDNDGGAEIVTVASQSFLVGAPPRQGIVVIGDANDNWVHARRIWNQWLYNPAYVNEDASIPPLAGNSSEIQNSLREQIPLEGVDPFAAPDLTVSQVTVDASNCPVSATVTARIGNGGSLQAGPGVRVNFYLGDPAAGGTLLGSRFISRPLFPGKFEDVSFEWTAPLGGEMFVTVNETPPASKIASSNLSLLANTWAKANGFQGTSSVPVNQLVFNGIDGNNSTTWRLNAPNIDPGPNYYEVHLPFPVEVTSVTIQNASASDAFLGTGTLTFSNGFTTTINLGATGAGSVSFPEQTGITWIKLTSTAAGSNGPGLAEFIIGGSYVQPPFLTREGDGRLGNNSASVVLNDQPCALVSPPPVVEAGPDQTVFDGDTVSLNPATFTDSVLLETHTATIDWGDGAVETGTLLEANGSGTIAGSHNYAAEGTYVVTVTVFDAAGNSDVDTFAVTVLNVNLRQAAIDVIASDPSVAFVNLTGPLAGIGVNQVAEFDVRLLGKESPHAFELRFVQSGRLLGSIPVTVNETYHYAVQALDGDGDTITYRLLESPVGAAIDANTGLLTWTPHQPGTYSFRVEAADDRGGITTQAYSLTVHGLTNQPPEITSTPPERASVNREFSYRVTATHPDGLRLSFFLTRAPAGMAIDSDTGVVTWRPALAQLGTHTVTVAVRDARGNMATQTFDLPVTRDTANQSPEITSTPPSIADPGLLYRYQVTASDPENDPLRFDLPLRPAGMSIHPTSGILTWLTSALQAGVHDVIVRVRDSQGAVTLQPYRVTVREPNTLPVIVSSLPPQAVAGLPFEHRMRGQDLAGETLSYHLDSGPAGAAIDVNTGILRWTPTVAQVGTQSLTIAVADDRGGATMQSFTILVAASAPNDPPAILSAPRTTIGLASHYVYQVRAIDPNADPLTYSLAAAPTGMTVDAFGLVSWAPAPGQFGTNAVQVRVEDGRGGVAVQDFAVTVVSTAQNQSPVMVSTPPAGAVVGQLFAYDLQATDLDGDPLVYSLLSGPRGMSIHPELGTVRWLPAADQVGAHNVVVQVLDAQGAMVTQSFRLEVRSVNTPPVITSAPPTEAAVGVLSTHQVRGFDHDNDPLTFSLLTFPAGTTIDPATGLIQWTPADQQLGPQQVVVLVDDGLGGTATQSYTVVVSATPANLPPVITSAPLLVADAGTEYDYQIAGIDPEGQALEFLLLQAPAGMFLDPAVSGLLRWTPSVALVGPATVTVAARDPGGATAVQSFTIDVADNNSPPAIISTPVRSAAANAIYRYDLQATDPDGDLLRFDLESGPAGMTLDVRQSGGQGQLFSGVFAQLSWAPGAADVGTTHSVRVRVTDPRGLSATQEFDVTVAADTQAPRVIVQVIPGQVSSGQAATIIVSATDDVGVQTRDLTVGGMQVALDSNGRGSVTMSQAGLFDVLATAADAAGNTATVSSTLLIIDPSVTGAPVVSLLTPIDGADVTAPTDVIGTADDPDLALWTLSVAPAGTRSFTEIARGTTPVLGGVLDRFDPTLLQNDSYTLRLTATDTGGNTASVERTVNVSGNLKLGNFTLSFSDMSVPVSGIPITVTRTYDTLQASRNADLGFGWRLEFRDVQLRTSVPRTGDEQYGIFAPFRDGTRVYITLPGGKREGFTFRPTEHFLFGARYYLPHFVPDAGVTSRLTPPGEVDNSGRFAVGAFGTFLGLGGAITLYKDGDGGYHTSEHVPYNPADYLIGGQYVLTTKDGTRYTIDALRGKLDTVEDRNGNTLSFSDGGIVSSAGPAITFERDAQQRITAVMDPMGNRVRYHYDANGDLVAVTDREGHTAQFRYRGHPAHYLEEVIDPLGRMGARSEYDADGRLVRLVNGADNVVQFVHDPDNSTETVLDARGNPMTYEYDEHGNIVTEIDALGGVTRRAYDASNNLLSETDPLGRTSSFTYDSTGNALSETDPLGNVRRFTYAADGAPLTVTDPLGNTREFGYDPKGNPLRINDANGQSLQLAVDAAGNQTAITMSDGAVFAAEFDRTGRRTLQVDSLGHETRLSYDANGNWLHQTVSHTISGTPRQLTTTYSYDANNRLVSVTDGLGGVSQIEYIAIGKVSARVDALGRRTSYEYDAAGRLVRTLYPDGLSETAEYDPAGNKVRQTDRSGRVTTFEYDALNRLVTTILPDETSADVADNPRTRTEYDAAGQVMAQIDANGQRTEFVYDLAGRQRQVTLPQVFDAVSGTVVRPEIQMEYDAAGNQTAQVDANGHRTEFSYDALRRLTRTIFADGTTQSREYDAQGRVVGVTDQAGQTTRYDYDSLGQLIAVTQPSPEPGSALLLTRYAYDEAGNLLRQTDALGRVTYFSYDELGRLVEKVLPLGQSELFAYDAVGNRTQHTDFNGDTTTYRYDAMNRLRERLYSDGSTVVFTYTPTGQRQTVVDARGATTYLYDARDQLISRSDPDGRTIAYVYDAAGNQISMTVPSGTTAYTFDALHRLETVTAPSGGVTRYFYDPAGNLVRTELPNSTVETRQYDDLSRLVFLESTGPGGAVISSYRYTLSAAGLRTAVTEDSGRVVSYTYDGDYRLTGESIVDPAIGDRTIVYTYDAVGNRLTRNDSAVGLTAYGYDVNDRLLTEALAGDVTLYTYDDSGNLLSRVRAADDRAFYAWDFENRLVAAQVTDASGTHDLAYEYDADGNRVSQTVDGTVTRFLIDTSTGLAQVAEEYSSGGVIQASYVRGLGLIMQDRAGVKSYYHADGLSSIRFLTTALGSVTDGYVYDAFGRLLARSGATSNFYQFTGEQFDPNLRFNHLRARYYDLATGRFVSSDPFEGALQNPITLHRYVYGGADPVNNVDPTGRAFSPMELALTSTIIGVLVGIGVGFYTESFWWGAGAGIVAALLVNEGLIALGALGQGVATGAFRATFTGARLPRAVRLRNFWNAFRAAKNGEPLTVMQQSVLRQFARQIPEDLAQELSAHGITKGTVHRLFYGTGRAIILYLMLGDAMKLYDPDTREESVANIATSQLADDPEGGRMFLLGAGVATTEIASDEPKRVREIAWEAMGLLADFVF